MREEAILQKAVEKAIRNGWYKYGSFNAEIDGKGGYWHSAYAANPEELVTRLVDERGVYGIIFSHSFAKCFWGEEPFSEFRVQWHSMKVVDEKYQGWRKLEKWQYHLQQMVLEENPILYLEKFLTPPQEG